MRVRKRSPYRSTLCCIRSTSARSVPTPRIMSLHHERGSRRLLLGEWSDTCNSLERWCCMARVFDFPKSASFRNTLLARQADQCAVCGSSIAEVRNLELSIFLHHVVPEQLGRSNDGDAAFC